MHWKTQVMPFNRRQSLWGLPAMTPQKFSTLAGRTTLPRLQVQFCDTLLTQQVFDATTSSNLAASFGQTKIGLEVRSASPEQFDGDFNAEKWHKHVPTPWDVMQLSPAQALTISCQSCGVQIAPSDRDTCGRPPTPPA